MNEEGRWAIGIQWHPEFTFENEAFEDLEEKNILIMKGFAKKCLEYKNSKKQH